MKSEEQKNKTKKNPQIHAITNNVKNMEDLKNYVCFL